MTKDSTILDSKSHNFEEPKFQGMYGPYTITYEDQVEVQRYRLAVLICALSFSTCLGQWLLIGSTWSWVWLVVMAASLGMALKWIHIYLRPLHRALQIFWALGSIGLIVLGINVGTDKILSSLGTDHLAIILIGPLFAALTGLGFKEFFCFRRLEAIGLTLLVPLALLGYLTGLIGKVSAIFLLSLSAIFLLVLAIRKFGMDASDDIGDKSVFQYLESQSAKAIL